VRDPAREQRADCYEHDEDVGTASEACHCVDIRRAAAPGASRVDWLAAARDRPSTARSTVLAVTRRRGPSAQRQGARRDDGVSVTLEDGTDAHVHPERVR
jgi:hypothetical protein